jgi:hypothetical protein
METLRWLRPLLVVAMAWGATACATAPGVPSWAASTPHGYWYHYVTGSGTAGTVSASRAAAIEDAYQTLVRSAPRSYRAAAFRQEFEVVADEVLGGGGGGRVAGTQRVRTDGRLSGEILEQAFPRLEIVSTDLRTCTRCSTVTAYVLFRYLKPGGQRRDPPTTPGFVARSVVIPGWGQMAKGARGKGWTLLLGTLGSAGVAAASEWQYRALYDSASMATAQRDRDAYLLRANPHRITALSAVALAGGLYTYGVLDAALGPVRFYPIRNGVGVSVVGR